jgi:predicted dehydrogenase
MLRVGIVGLGFMGWIHWLVYKRVPGIEVTSICEQDEVRRRGDWRRIRGNFGPPGEIVDLSRVRVFETLDQMLADGQFDVVDVCLPPSLHCDAVIRSLGAGKHVFCEKPMALNVADCERMVDSARAANRRLFIGHVLPFFPEYSAARYAVQSGKFGRLLGGTFKRVISDPTWLNEFYDPERIGGPLIDLHVHDAHFIRLLFGMPRRAISRGRTRNGVVAYCNSLLEFEDPGVVVSCVTGVIDQQGRPFTHGFELHLEQATLQFEFAALADKSELMPLKFLRADGRVERPTIFAGDDIAGFVAEIEEVKGCLVADCDSAILGGNLARDAIVICQMQAQAVLGQSN